MYQFVSYLVLKSFSFYLHLMKYIDTYKHLLILIHISSFQKSPYILLEDFNYYYFPFQVQLNVAFYFYFPISISEEIIKQHYRITQQKMQISNCIICLEKITDKYIVLQCDHSYHKECIDNWVKQKPICPMCRSSIK
ncbi:unnamed protein product (macronuclear) [Paramecium tetraurelia]|uniref:RING-type E3 ubiquitin transferase n=1 Tax=Paramecium tetraurelia TaxID=5888 RepID=A0CJR7_PARTE|nr:uncharacterized protein GSPATT00000746001 [Paramecium tetraurelia]CAK71034.1 unnamed protein product [Paramecium tetraurelia]|eukprot:XP_001438431.1 hypothetical protein (macronuclear) [Paramecium tetraurelia strain d4-2]